MKPFIRNRVVFSAVAVVFLFFSIAVNGAAQTAEDDPTSIKIPEEKMQVPVVPDQPRYKDSAWIQLGAGLLCAAGGTVLCVIAGNTKGAYDSAQAAWLKNSNGKNTATRDTAGVNFFVPLISGIGLTATGVILVLSGLSDGVGVYGYKAIVPAAHAANGTPEGPSLYAFVSPTSIGISLK